MHACTSGIHAASATVFLRLTCRYRDTAVTGQQNTETMILVGGTGTHTLRTNNSLPTISSYTVSQILLCPLDELKPRSTRQKPDTTWQNPMSGAHHLWPPPVVGCVPHDRSVPHAQDVVIGCYSDASPFLCVHRHIISFRQQQPFRGCP